MAKQVIEIVMIDGTTGAGESTGTTGGPAGSTSTQAGGFKEGTTTSQPQTSTPTAPSATGFKAGTDKQASTLDQIAATAKEAGLKNVGGFLDGISAKIPGMDKLFPSLTTAPAAPSASGAYLGVGSGASGASGAAAGKAAGAASGITAAAGPVGIALAAGFAMSAAGTKAREAIGKDTMAGKAVDLAISPPIFAFGKAIKIAADEARRFGTVMNSEADRLQGLSPELALAQSQRSIRRETADITRAQRLGPSLARFTNMQSRVENTITELQTRFYQLGLKLVDGLMPLIEPLLRAAETMPQFLDNALEAVGVIKSIATLDFASIPGAVQRIVENVTKIYKHLRDGETEEADPFADQIMNLFAQQQLGGNALMGGPAPQFGPAMP